MTVSQQVEQIKRTGITGLVQMVQSGDLDLRLAYRIAGLTVAEQKVAITTGISEQKLEMLWDEATGPGRQRLREAACRIMGLVVARKVNGALFLDVVEEQELTGRRVPTDGEFEAFYKQYPRQVNRKKSSEAFRKAFGHLRKTLSIEETVRTIMDGVARYRKALRPDDTIAHPTTWLNGHRWEDDPRAISNENKKPGRGVGSAAHGKFVQNGKPSGGGKTPIEEAVF